LNWIATAAITVAAIAAATDLWHRRIPNWLTVGGIALGLALNVSHGTWLDALQGLGLALAIHLPLFALRLTSGGDVKLMAALGAIAGPRHFLTIFVFSAVLGGLAALYIAWRNKRLAGTLANVGDMLKGRQNLDQRGALTLPRGPVALAATLLWEITLR
jgi:prepilin peptidase CpaA